MLGGQNLWVNTKTAEASGSSCYSQIKWPHTHCTHKPQFRLVRSDIMIHRSFSLILILKRTKV